MNGSNRERQLDLLQQAFTTRHAVRLEMGGEQATAHELSDFDLVRLLEAMTRQPDGLAALEASGMLACLDAEEAEWRAVYDRPGLGQQVRALDDEESRWPTLRSRLLWQEWERARRRGELYSARSKSELAAWAERLMVPYRGRGGERRAAPGYLRLVSSKG